MDLSKVVKRVLRSVEEAREDDEIYRWFLIHRDTHERLIKEKLVIPSYENPTLISNIATWIATLKTITDFSARKALGGIDYLREWLRSFGFTPTPSLEDTHVKRLSPLLASVYKQKGTLETLEQLIAYLYTMKEVQLVEIELVSPDWLMGVYKGEKLPELKYPTSVLLGDPLWRIPLDTIHSFPVRTSYFSVLYPMHFLDVCVEVLTLQVFADLEVLETLETGNPPVRSITIPFWPTFLSVSECVFLCKGLYYILNKYYHYDATRWNDVQFFYEDLGNLNVHLYYLFYPKVSSIDEAPLSRNVLLEVLKQKLSLTDASLYEVITDFLYTHQVSIRQVKPVDLYLYIVQHWERYSPEKDPILHSIAAVVLESAPAWLILARTRSMVQLFYDSYPTPSLSTTYDEYYNVVLPQSREQTQVEVDSYLPFWIDKLGLNWKPQYRDPWKIFEELVKRLSPVVWDFLVHIESQFSTITDPWIKDQVALQISSWIGTILSVLAQSLSLSALVYLHPTLRGFQEIVHFLKPVYARPLGDIPVYWLVVDNIVENWLRTKAPLDRIEEMVYFDSALVVGQQKYLSAPYTFPKITRQELYNLDQYWTSLNQGLQLNEGSYIMFPHISTRTYPIHDQRTAYPIWELDTTHYAPLQTLPLVSETETEVTVGPTYRHEAWTWHLVEATLAESIKSLLAPQVGYVRGSDGVNYPIVDSPPSSYPEEVQLRIRSFDLYGQRVLRDLVFSSDVSYYARYGDDLVIIQSYRNGEPEYNFLVFQN